MLTKEQVEKNVAAAIFAGFAGAVALLPDELGHAVAMQAADYTYKLLMGESLGGLSIESPKWAVMETAVAGIVVAATGTKEETQVAKDKFDAAREFHSDTPDVETRGYNQ